MTSDNLCDVLMDKLKRDHGLDSLDIEEVDFYLRQIVKLAKEEAAEPCLQNLPSCAGLN